MPEFTNDQRRNILAALQKAHANEPCPRCGNTEFVLLDGYTTVTTNQGVTPTFIIGGPTIPAVVTVCKRCGFIAQHAIGALGLLPQEVEQNAGHAR